MRVLPVSDNTEQINMPVLLPGPACIARAVREGIINDKDDLLFPCFNMVKGLGPWLEEAIHERMEQHPNWQS